MFVCDTGGKVAVCADTTYGPLSSEPAVHNLQAQVDDAVEKGATVRTGGRRVEGPGAFFEPSVLTDVVPEMRAFREELFGPVVDRWRFTRLSARIARTPNYACLRDCAYT